MSAVARERWRPYNASRMLAQTLRELGMAKEWHRVHRELRIVRDVSLNLARFLTLHVPGEKGYSSLFAQCLAGALAEWRASGEARAACERYHAYLRGLLLPVPEALEWAVCFRGVNAETYWDPMCCGLLDAWRASGGVVEVHRRARPRDSAYVGVVPADFRFLVLVRFLARRELRLSPLAACFGELVGRYE